MIDKKSLQIAIGKTIRELREERNIPQQVLANTCNFEKSNFSRLEAGGTNPTIYTLSIIADRLKVNLNELTTFKID